MRTRKNDDDKRLNRTKFCLSKTMMVVAVAIRREESKGAWPDT